MINKGLNKVITRYPFIAQVGIFIFYRVPNLAINCSKISSNRCHVELEHVILKRTCVLFLYFMGATWKMNGKE